MSEQSLGFYGKYRGTVVQAEDPQRLGRVKVSVPGVCRDTWAMPCSPFAGTGVAFSVVPPKSAKAWIEFEAGDPGKPIVTGYYWDRPMPPVLSAAVEISPDEIQLSYRDAKITLSEKGIEVMCGTVKLKLEAARASTECGPSKLELSHQGVDISAGSTAASFGSTQAKVSSSVVSINDGALQVI